MNADLVGVAAAPAGHDIDHVPTLVAVGVCLGDLVRVQASVTLESRRRVHGLAAGAGKQNYEEQRRHAPAPHPGTISNKSTPIRLEL